jgi:lipopolysaccharide cholinephosphotransferase
MKNDNLFLDNGELTPEALRRLQLTQLEIFRVIDAICRANNIPYTLYGGTLLGAVRHKGFIPWDDDLDIAMTRDNYNRFVDAWNITPVAGYFFQEYENDPEYTRTFGKLRKENTEFYGHDEVGKNYHHGIFVDIFPFDKVDNKSFAKFMHKLVGYIYLLFSRRYAPVKNGVLLKVGSKVLLKLVPKRKQKQLLGNCKKYLMKEPKTNDFYYITYSSFRTVNWGLPKTLFDTYDEVEFEGMKAMVFGEKEAYLKNTYGDYLQLPPKEKRKGSHIIVKLKF